MGLSATAKRRWFGVLVLAAALGMLIAGQTVLQGRMRGFLYLLYWLVCLALTVLAMLVALWDARVMRLRSRQQQRNLLETTLEKIIADAKAKPGNKSARGKR